MELVRKGKRVYGAFFELSSAPVYCAFRTPGDIFKTVREGSNKFKSISEALKDETAAWAIDDDHLQMARRRGCKNIAVWVRKLNWLFITPIENFFDRTKYQRRDYGGRGGSDQRYLPVHHFRQLSREVKLGRRR